jgi:sigma-54 dependent transcriptional regulator, acetoin dehydrogenase operon transcriptional activator AcoR
MSGGQTIEPEHLPEDFVEAAAPTVLASGDAPVRSLELLEIEAIEAALRTCGGNISEASKRLGISRNTIYRRLRCKDQHA